MKNRYALSYSLETLLLLMYKFKAGCFAVRHRGVPFQRLRHRYNDIYGPLAQLCFNS